MVRRTISIKCLRESRPFFCPASLTWKTVWYSEIEAPVDFTTQAPPECSEVYHLCRYGRIGQVHPTAKPFQADCDCSYFTVLFTGDKEESCQTYRQMHQGLHKRASWTGEAFVSVVVDAPYLEVRGLVERDELRLARQHTGADVWVLPPLQEKNRRRICIAGAESRVELAAEVIEAHLATSHALEAATALPPLDDEINFPPLLPGSGEVGGRALAGR